MTTFARFRSGCSCFTSTGSTCGFDPSLNDAVFRSIALETFAEALAPCYIDSIIMEIERWPEERSPRRSSNYWEDYRISGGDFFLKRSHSFGFERSSASADRMMVTEPVTASKWRYRRGSFWSNRPSRFGSLTKSRVFSFRSAYRDGVNMKSPFFRRKGFFRFSESRKDYRQVEFAALEQIENLDFHVDSVRLMKLYNRIKEVLALVDSR